MERTAVGSGEPGVVVPPTRASAGERLALLAVAGLLVALGYGANAHDFFLCDDFGFLSRGVQAPNALRGFDLEKPVAGMWMRPLSSGSWYLTTRVSLDPLPYHLVNFGFHALNAWLVGMLGLALGLPRRAAWAATLLFATSPVHPEAVTWLSGRVDVLCASAALTALLAWTRFARGGSAGALALTCAAFAVALGCKEMAITLPVVAPLLALFVLRAPLRRMLIGAAALGVVALAYVGLRWWLLGEVGGYKDESGVSVVASLDPVRAMHFAFKAMRYALCPSTPGVLPDGLFWLRYLPLPVFAAGALLALRAPARRRELLTALGLGVVGLVALAPVANWAWIRWDYLGSRFLYFPSAIGLLALASLVPGALGAPDAKGERRQMLAFVAGLALLLVPQVISLRNLNAQWSESARISRRTLDVLLEHVPERRAVPPLGVTGLTDIERNAYLWLNGFAEAARLFTPWTGQVLDLEPEAFLKLEAELSPEVKRRRVFLRWLPDEERFERIL